MNTILVQKPIIVKKELVNGAIHLRLTDEDCNVLDIPLSDDGMAIPHSLHPEVLMDFVNHLCHPRYRKDGSEVSGG